MGETLSIFWRTSINFNNAYKGMKNYNHIDIHVYFDIQLHKKVAVRKKTNTLKTNSLFMILCSKGISICACANC